ncbi:uncharacterized protein LOC130928619 [Corythoichthys intestinalis]|uniref:uncharacterized protein LOC130928619 n=1 Tax=Corythoichthys intestinalis TaxID=161448 RepID=UPI0025A5FF54|nr:uncharacterized protein LOC130928619 [Corythoichthys intestinalis]
MRGCLLVIWLLACGCQALNYTGTAVTYHHQKNLTDKVVVRYKLGFSSCLSFFQLNCSTEACGVDVVSVKRVDQNIGEWCQEEVVAHVSTGESAPIKLGLNGLRWIPWLANNVTEVMAVSKIEFSERSDTRQPNVSPRTTVLPVVRVPSGCAVKAKLPTFDPDGDRVKCFALRSDNNPSFLHLKEDCSMTIGASYKEASYAVQLHMQDIVREDIYLTNSNENGGHIPQDEPISDVAIQFVLRVGPPVGSCNEGDYLPYFVDPTPQDGDHLYASVNKKLEIRINATAEKSNITGLLFSGPAGIQKSYSDDGSFLLAYTPSPIDAAQRHALCFVVQAFANTTGNASLAELHSPMRCVIIVVDHTLFALEATFRLRTFNAMQDINNVALPQLKKELVLQGLPPDISLRVVKFQERHLNITDSGF